MFSKFSLIFATLFVVLGFLSQPVLGTSAEDLLDILYDKFDKNTTAPPLSDIPQQCSGQCSQSVLEVFSNCTSKACACENQDSDDITTCMNCLVQANTLQVSIGNAIQGDYVNICNNMGMAVVDNLSAAASNKMSAIAVLGGAVVMGLVLWV